MKSDIDFAIFNDLEHAFSQLGIMYESDIAEDHAFIKKYFGGRDGKV